MNTSVKRWALASLVATALTCVMVVLGWSLGTGAVQASSSHEQADDATLNSPAAIHAYPVSGGWEQLFMAAAR